MVELKGRTVIVTGASMGIGRALAAGLADAGASLVLNARHEGPLRQAAEACGRSGIEVRTVAGSAGSGETVARIREEAQRTGSLCGFIHAAGLLHPGPTLWELSEEQFREVLEANVLGAFQLIRVIVPILREQGMGLAVFFGSGASERSVPGIGAYCAAKAAEERLALQVARESPEITTFIYRPGVVETRMQQSARESSGGGSRELRAIFHAFRDRGELLTPEESARALINILLEDPRRFHGGTATARDGMEPDLWGG
jgi:NAD(P)-dependent dehydrogenase (short-subunit alcohol dehydrogenase family)